MDERPGDDVSVLARVESELEDVERALARLDDGTYATCEACGGTIGADRLSEWPLTRRCAEHTSSPAPHQATEI
jgi:RNA polymerase-binding transcription factor DksA